MFRYLFPLFYLEADAGAGSGGDSGGGDKGGAGNGGAAGDSAGDKPKTFTQAELDDILTKRLARDKKAWEATLEEEKKKAAMTEVERLKAEKEESDKKASDALAAVDKKSIAIDVKAALLEAGIKPDRIKAALQLADISEIGMVNGEPDAKGIKLAVEAVVAAYPEFKGVAAGSSGSEMGGSGPTPKDIDSQIAEAIKNGNVAESIRLKAIKYKI